jgi:O-antigen/teichoic acid export membrane protein
LIPWRNISINTLQVLGNQILGVFIFLLLSRYLNKDSYGELNWALAVLTVITTILSLRLEQIVVRDVAAGKNASALLTLFLFHTVAGAFLFLSILLVCRLLFPVFFGHHPLLWLLSFSQLLLFISLPFRQLVTGRSAFGWLAVLASCSNAIRCLGLLGFVLFRGFTLPGVLVLFTVSALAEWLVGGFIVFYQLKVPLERKLSFSGYSTLIRDSLPQVGLVFLNAGMARLDWILMGLFSTPAHTAEYSFAYRAYEFSPLPLLVMAPFLLNSFSRRCVNGIIEAPAWLDQFVRAGLIFGTLLPLLGVLSWVPLVDWLTLGKYGQTNALPFFLLSCSIPFQYLINVYWSAGFAANRLGRIFTITAITAGVVLAGDLVLIPYFAGRGAALAWLAAMVVQFLLYSSTPFLPGARKWSKQLLLAIAIAVVAGGLALVVASSLSMRLGIAIVIYVLLAWFGGLVDREWIKGIFQKMDIPGVSMKRLQAIDWSLLLFLVGMLNVKLYIKVAAILFALLLFRKRAIPRDVYRQRHLWFYAAMLVLASCNLLLSLSSLSGAAFFAFGLGYVYWLLALLAAYHIYLFTAWDDDERLHHTVSLFFLLNGVFMLISFLVVCFKAGVINPYTYEGEHRRYFINTGDMITGISLDGSVTTALIGAFGVLYFFYRNRKLASLFCLATLLLAGSNFVDLLLIGVFLFISIFRSNRLQKSMVIISMMIIAVFFAKVSPQNGEYVREIMKRLDGKHVYDEPVPIPNAKDYEFVESQTVVRKEAMMKTFQQTLYPPKMEDSFKVKFKSYNRSGRWVSCQQMALFFWDHPELIPLGAGMGHFSSRLAFKSTGLDIAGGYPASKRYIDSFFRDNYLYLYLYYHSRDEGQHSVVNKPDSVYGQLLGEYGLAGLLLFGILYAGFFLKRSRHLTYGLPLLLLMGMAFFTEYWFEQLSVVILFELLLLLDKKPHQS